MGVAGGHEQGRAVEGDAALSPTAPSVALGRPRAEHRRRGQIETHHPAVIVQSGAVAGVPGIGDVEVAVDQGERAALPLGRVVEAFAQRGEPSLDVDRPARR